MRSLILATLFLFAVISIGRAQNIQPADTSSQPMQDQSSDAPVDTSVSASTAPPELPEYTQPECPESGYLWQPGYWAFSADTNGYYWVPGVWVAAPTIGYLWTPCYWGFYGGLYVFHTGYWGENIGFYGGINYGYGYAGVGFIGGEWRGGYFNYNTAVLKVNTTVIHNTYVDRTVINTATVNRRTSFNGPGGSMSKPNNAEIAASRGHHIMATAEQNRNQRLARADKSQFANTNGGHPSNLATAKVAEGQKTGIGRTVNATPGSRPGNSSVSATPGMRSANNSVSAAPGSRIKNEQGNTNAVNTPTNGSISASPGKAPSNGSVNATPGSRQGGTSNPGNGVTSNGSVSASPGKAPANGSVNTSPGSRPGGSLSATPNNPVNRTANTNTATRTSTAPSHTNSVNNNSRSTYTNNKPSNTGSRNFSSPATPRRVNPTATTRQPSQVSRPASVSRPSPRLPAPAPTIKKNHN